MVWVIVLDFAADGGGDIEGDEEAAWAEKAGFG